MSALTPILRTRSGTLSPLFTALRPTVQCRNANLIRRPKRPYLLDQIIILSDGSTYKQLTTSPKGIIRSTKDIRNNPLWNPSIKEFGDVEEDEAGRLRRFRERFGMGFESETEEGAEDLESLLVMSGTEAPKKK